MGNTSRYLMLALGLTLPLQCRTLARRPAGFEQAPQAGRFEAKGFRHSATMMPQGYGIRLGEREVHVSVLNGNVAAVGRGMSPLPVKTSYLRGDRKLWRTGVPAYRKVRYEDVLPGVAMEYYAAGEHLEFDLILAPGTDPNTVALRYAGQDDLHLDGEGNLVVTAGGEQLIQRSPAVYQRRGDSLLLVTGNYTLDRQNEVRFQLGPYDRTKPLVIDPAIVYTGTLAGNGSDVGTSIVRFSDGKLYVAGTTGSTNLKVVGNAPQQARSGDTDVFVMKVNPNAASDVQVEQLTYLGGTGADELKDMKMDASGVIYLAGVTSSTNFPIAGGATQTASGGDKDAFVAKLNLELPAASALLYSTYIGGSGLDAASSLAVDTNGNVFIAGYTGSTNFPAAGSAYQSGNAGGWDAFVTQLGSTGGLVYSTYLGGDWTDTARSVALSGDGSVIVTGTTSSSGFPLAGHSYRRDYQSGGDLFIAKLSPTQGLQYSSYLGGGSLEDVKQVEVNAAGQAVLTGWTLSSNFPTTGTAVQTEKMGSTDTFLTVLDLNAEPAAALVYSTFIGGGSTDIPYSMQLDSSGSAWISGYTYSNDFPHSQEPLQATLAGGIDAYVVQIDPTLPGPGGLLYASYVGGGQSDVGYGINIDVDGNVYLTGTTNSRRFPTPVSDERSTEPGNYDAFILTFRP